MENVKNGIRTGFLKIDEYMRNFSDLRNGMDRSGSTAVGVMISLSISTSSTVATHELFSIGMDKSAFLPRITNLATQGRRSESKMQEAV